MSEAESIMQTVLQAIGTSGCLAVAGAVAARRGLITDTGRKSMAELSMNLLMPLLLFTSTLDVRPGATYVPLSELIQQSYVLLIMPLLVVSSGMALGKLVAVVTPCPQDFNKACVGAVAFANSTGMSITLLQVISPTLLSQGVVTVDPLKYLPVYLLLYPILQWTIGSYLFGLLGAPETKEDAEMGIPETNGPRVASITRRRSNRSLPELDFASDPDFYPLDGAPWRTSEEVQAAGAAQREEESDGSPLSTSEEESDEVRAIQTVVSVVTKSTMRAMKAASRFSCVKAALKFIRNGLVPPVIGCLCGLVASLILPLHCLFVDEISLKTSGVNAAPLAFAFTAMRTIGQASVPMNMLVLGSNLSKGCDFKAIPISTNLGILFMKNLGQPALMALMIFVLSRLLKCPDVGLWLVAMILSCTPTANNIMVMVELSGQNKAGVTTCIFTQYMAAPFVLTLVISTFLLYKDILVFGQ